MIESYHGKRERDQTSEAVNERNLSIDRLMPCLSVTKL